MSIVDTNGAHLGPWAGRRAAILFVLGVCSLATTTLEADEQTKMPDKPSVEELLGGRFPNWKFRTMGGKQFWTDQLIYHDWRIQRNVLTNHCRLLDDKNVRRAWGSYRSCLNKFQELRTEKELPAMDGKVVILLHGLHRSRGSMAGLAKYLEENGEFHVVNMSYASSRGEIGDHAAALARVIKNLPEAKELHLIGHSLGNLVIRHYWADQSQSEQGRQPDPRIKHVVMLAPPNNGAHLAKMFEDWALFRLIWGVSGRQIAEWNELEQRLGTPSCEFGIIAGGAGDERGRSPLLEGDDDFVVTVEETKLAGAHDFVVLPTSHTSIMDFDDSRECILRFLRKGFFLSRAQRAPLPAPRQTAAQPTVSR